MEPQQNRAYNQTRECFLGLEVVAGDFTPASLNDWIPTLTPNSGAGIWMVPFRGIPTKVDAPLDLVYLDQDCRVLETVEFFPTYRVSPASPPAASVLALPTHSIFSSQTRRGDQLMLCATGEMTWRLEQLSQSGTSAGLDPIAPTDPGLGMRLDREEPKPNGAPAHLETPHLPGRQEEPHPIHPLQEDPTNQPDCNSPATPAGKPIVPPRRWLERWLFPDRDPRRKTPRLPAPGLTAHFFTGGGPQAHAIRDISDSGLYVVTSERWYPGTLIRITLCKPDQGQPLVDRSVTIQARSVRWGNDGVGLEFVFDAPQKLRPGHRTLLDLVDSSHLGKFLKRLGAGNP